MHGRKCCLRSTLAPAEVVRPQYPTRDLAPANAGNPDLVYGFRLLYDHVVNHFDVFDFVHSFDEESGYE